MKVGDSIKFDFAGSKKDGVVHKLCPNTVYVKVDFEKHKGKIVKRKLSSIQGGKTKEKSKAKK
jgi:hypothetical protein